MSRYKTTLNERVKYDQQTILGAGGFCKVYDAKYQKFGSDGKPQSILAALKILSPQAADSEVAAVKYFEEECKLLMTLDHPNLVKAYEYDVTNPRIKWVLLERCQHSLYSLLKPCNEGPVSEANARTIAVAVLSGLQKLHSMKIVHRDLKLENILYSDQSGYKIADFGLAKQSTQGSKIMMKSFLGTKEYMAPEIFLANQQGKGTYNQSVDIYAFADVIFTLCSGAFRVGDAAELFEIKDATLKFDPLTFKYPKHFTPDLINMLKRCWSFNPNERPSASELMAHPWVGLSNLNYSPKALATLSLAGANKMIKEQSNPAEFYWPLVADYIGCSLWEILKEHSRKLHKRYRHIVDTYESTKWWELAGHEAPSFASVRETFEGLVALFLYNNMVFKCDILSSQVDLTVFEFWQNDQEFIRRSQTLEDVLTNVTANLGDDATQSKLAGLFTSQIEQTLVELKESRAPHSKALSVFVSTFARDMNNLMMKLFTVNIEFDFNFKAAHSLMGVELPEQHKQGLKAFVTKQLEEPSGIYAIEFTEPVIDNKKRKDFKDCQRFIKVNMYLVPVANPIFDQMTVSTIA